MIPNQKKVKGAVFSALCILALFLISLLFSLSAKSQFLVDQSFFTDSSVFRYVARVMQAGGTPYLDTFDHKGPFLYVLNALALWLSPDKGLWLVELISLFFFFLMSYRIARLFCRKSTSVIATLALLPALNQYFEGGNLTESYALPFIAGAIYIFSDFFLNGNITRFRLFLCGACLGAVLLLRVNMIAVWVVMCIGVLVHCIVSREYKKIFFFLLYFFIGLLTFILPFIIWLASEGALRDFWKDYILFNFTYAADDQRANVYAKMDSFLYFLHTTFTAASFAIIGIAIFTKKTLLNILYFLSLLVTLLFICISGQTYGHYGIVIVPLLIIPAAYLGKACDKARAENHLGTVFLSLILLVYTVLPTWSSLITGGISLYQNRGSSDLAPDVSLICDWIHENTSPDDPVLVCGNRNDIYNQSGRFAPTQYSYQSPICSINPEMEAEFFRELEENKPAAIFLPDDYFAREKMLEFITRHNYIQSLPEQEVFGASFYLLP